MPYLYFTVDVGRDYQDQDLGLTIRNHVDGLVIIHCFLDVRLALNWPMGARGLPSIGRWAQGGQTVLSYSYSGVNSLSSSAIRHRRPSSSYARQRSPFTQRGPCQDPVCSQISRPFFLRMNGSPPGSSFQAGSYSAEDIKCSAKISVPTVLRISRCSAKLPPEIGGLPASWQ